VKMTKQTRKSMTVDPNGKWRLYTNSIPARTTVLGVVKHGDRTGALIRFQETGQYAMVNAGCAHVLDGRSVAAALGKAGRPSTVHQGRRMTVFMDSESILVAQSLGNGNLSEGVRRSLRMNAQSMDQEES
jgi:hypothetical protein